RRRRGRGYARNPGWSESRREYYYKVRGTQNGTRGAGGDARGLTGSCGGRPQDSAWRGALRVAGHPHFESPQLRQVMQPSIMITAAVLHLAQSWAPSGYSLFEN